jgi:Xaa-Pro aminopeptidase
MERKQEVDVKLQRVRSFLQEKNLDALLLKKQPNFSWLTAGGLNMVGITTEMGVTSLLVTAQDAYVIASRIEANRMMQEEGLGELGFKLLEYEWYDNKEMDYVKEVVGEGRVGGDAAVPGVEDVAADVNRLRYELTEGEIQRYLFLGEKVSAAIEKTLTEVQPGDTEAEITGRLAAELWRDRIDPTGYMAAADERADLYRHPIPTMNKVKKYLMLCVNARYKGLITTITRLVHFGPVPEELRKQYLDNVKIECTMIAKTTIGTPMNVPLLTAIDMYENMGYHDEWKLHHQGGPMGYYGRDIRVHHKVEEKVRPNQAFCWNPSITGTKSEDGFIATPNGPLMISKPIIFPTVEMEVEGIKFVRPDILER